MISQRPTIIHSPLVLKIREPLIKLVDAVFAWRLWTWVGITFKVSFWTGWTALAGCLLWTWQNSLSEAKVSTVKYSELELLVLALLGLLAGFEIAFADLRDKDPSQVREVVRSVLKDMQNYGEEIYQAREWLGVLLIAAAALLAEFDWAVPAPLVKLGHTLHLHFPWAYIAPNHRKLVLSLLFTTFPVVWFAQGPAKFLAYWNSEKFLLYFRFTWPVIRAFVFVTRVFQLNFVSQLLLFPIARAWERDKRNLPPSDPALYVNMLKRYGCGVHDLKTDIVIQANGSAAIEQEFIVHVLTGSRTKYDIKQSCASACLTERCEIISAFFCPIPGEHISEIEHQLKVISNGLVPTGHEPIPRDYLSVKAFKDANNPQKAIVEFSSAVPLGTQDPARGAIIRIKFTTEWEAGAFETSPGKQDSYWFDFGIPYRRATTNIAFVESAKLGFSGFTRSVVIQGNEHRSEEKRVQSNLGDGSSKELTAAVRYALPGARYSVGWIVWNRN